MVILQGLFNATVSSHVQAINMAHELSLMMLGAGLLAEDIGDLLGDVTEPGKAVEALKHLTTAHRRLLAECQLGLFVVRNFLSYHSETRYKDVMRPRFTVVNLLSVVLDMVELYKLPASRKQIALDVVGIDALPSIHGIEMEIRRLLHNVLNNAIKYSYHSIPGVQRTIKIRAKVPHDPGFRERRFALVVENYGLGLTKEEHSAAFRPGFRGLQALGEVPIGAGIGLSEAVKIMQLHHGEIRLRSEEVHAEASKGPTYKTTVDLIFPYK